MSNSYKIERVVFTGTSGSGKSSVIDELEQGYVTVPEVAREWIPVFDSEYLHDVFGCGFMQNLIEATHIKNYLQYDTGIFDRGLVDEIAYRNIKNFSTYPLVLLINKYRYDKVFFFPFWEEIYKNDDVRKETAQQAKDLDMLIRSAYNQAGYQLIEVPKVSVEERVEFIKANLKKNI